MVGVTKASVPHIICLLTRLLFDREVPAEENASPWLLTLQVGATLFWRRLRALPFVFAAKTLSCVQRGFVPFNKYTLLL